MNGTLFLAEALDKVAQQLEEQPQPPAALLLKQLELVDFVSSSSQERLQALCLDKSKIIGILQFSNPTILNLAGDSISEYLRQEAKQLRLEHHLSSLKALHGFIHISKVNP